jgi:hypothetical protein
VKELGSCIAAIKWRHQLRFGANARVAHEFIHTDPIDLAKKKFCVPSFSCHPAL